VKPVTRGRLALIEPGFDVDDVENAKGQNSLNGQPSSAFNVTNRGELSDGRQFIEGAMAVRSEDRETYPYIHEDGTIELNTEDTVTREYSAYVAVPDEVLVYWEEFATDAFYVNTPAYDVKAVDLDLNEFVRENDIMNPTTVGFAGRPDQAEKGTVYGHGGVFSDDTFGEELQGSFLQQLGVTLDSTRFGLVDVYLARSGYVEVYDGISHSSEFAQLVVDDILPHTVDAEDVEEDDEEEAEDSPDATADDEQATLAETDDSGGEEPELCEACGKEPAYDLQEASDGRRVCIVCQDDIDNRGES